ncbi:hypothetical protein [Desulfolucanica intricata]|uniref:hypothetical protein n=1 Tax=Desulfolucanica intricata TaxID=1285191 RepID=UPI000831DCB6|nr:hypothetical protein [Desulfolucanica intricata]
MPGFPGCSAKKPEAEIIGQITNYFFVRMDEVWKGKLKEPENAAGLYEVVNHLLVNCFEETLSRLEAGEAIDEAAAKMLIDEFKMKIKSVFNQFPQTMGNTGRLSVKQDRGCI